MCVCVSACVVEEKEEEEDWVAECRTDKKSSATSASFNDLLQSPSGVRHGYLYLLYMYILTSMSYPTRGETWMYICIYIWIGMCVYV